MVEVGMAAATESKVCLAVNAGPISDEQPLEVLRLHCEDDEPGAGDGIGVRERRLDAVPLAQLVRSLLATSGRRRCRPSFASPDDSRPATSASPIFPQPRIAIRRAMTRV